MRLNSQDELQIAATGRLPLEAKGLAIRHTLGDFDR